MEDHETGVPIFFPITPFINLSVEDWDISGHLIAGCEVYTINVSCYT